MPNSDPVTDALLEQNHRYAAGESIHAPAFPGSQPIRPAKRVAVVACMDARMDVEDLLGLQTGDAHIIRNAGGIVTDDVIRCLVISHHLLDTNEIVLLHHTRCGMLGFTDELLAAGLEGDPAAVAALAKATGRSFTPCHAASPSPAAFGAFRGSPEPVDAPPTPESRARLAADVRRGLSAIRHHPWIPTAGPDAVTIRGFVYDVDTGRLEEVTTEGESRA